MNVRKWYKGASGATTLALSTAVVLLARADDGGDADIAASKEAKQRTKADVSNTEARLTQIGVKANKLRVSVAKAEAASIAAQQRLSTSIGEAMGVQGAVDSADKQIDAARRQLSEISTSIYKHGARAVAEGHFSPGAADYRQAREKARVYRILANKTNRGFQRLKGTRFEAATLQKKTNDKAAARKDMAHRTDEASAGASRVASNAETEVRTISAERDRLISKLAAQKGTAAELVHKQQDEKEAAVKIEAEQESQRVVRTANERVLRAAFQKVVGQTSPQQADGRQAGPQQAKSLSVTQAAPAAEDGEKPAATDPSTSRAVGSQVASQPAPAQEKAPTPEKPSGQKQVPATPATRERTSRAEVREQSQASKRAEAERQRRAQAVAQRRTQTAAAQHQAQQAAAEKQTVAQRTVEQGAATRTAAQKQAQGRAATEVARQKRIQAGNGSSSVVGTQIVAYARQFAGVRYVWDETNPSSGQDCVGFTRYVYAHFGHETPQRTGSYLGQFWKGYKVVPASQRQPGDLMWWPGHTGICTSNSMHITTWSPPIGTQEREVWGSPIHLRIVG